MQKKNLTDGIKAILYDNGALFILLTISVSPQPLITAALSVFSLAAVCLAAAGFAKRFKGKYMLVLSLALSGTVFGLFSRLVSYPQRDFIFIIFSLSAVYLIFILSRKFTGNIDLLNIGGALAAFIPAAFTIAAFAFIFKLFSPAQQALPAVAPNMALPAVAPNLALPAVAPNLALPAVAPNMALPLVAPNMALPPVAGLLITAGAIILYRILWRHIL